MSVRSPDTCVWYLKCRFLEEHQFALNTWVKWDHICSMFCITELSEPVLGWGRFYCYTESSPLLPHLFTEHNVRKQMNKFIRMLLRASTTHQRQNQVTTHARKKSAFRNAGTETQRIKPAKQLWGWQDISDFSLDLKSC